MKRALTLALTVAVIGGLAFMGVAGTAAAGDYSEDDDAEAQTLGDQGDITTISDLQYAETTVEQDQDVDQVNIGSQNAEAGTGGDGGDATVATDFGEDADFDDEAFEDEVEAEGGDGGDGGDNATVEQSMSQSNSNSQSATAISATLDEFDISL